MLSQGFVATGQIAHSMSGTGEELIVFWASFFGAKHAKAGKAN
jgi:hypothetical protein